MIKQILLLFWAVSAALALGNSNIKTAPQRQGPQQFASVASFHSAAPQRSASLPLNDAAAAPSPYSFGYEADSSARQESADSSGKVTGSYKVMNEDGSIRLVNYIADEQGFRAEVETDEAGTMNNHPANVVIRSNAPQVQYGAAPEQNGAFRSQQAKMFSGSNARQAPLQQAKMFSGSSTKQAPLQQARAFSSSAIRQAPIQQVKIHSNGNGAAQSSMQQAKMYTNGNGAAQTFMQQPSVQYNAQSSPQIEQPKPYSFGYNEQLDDGSISRHESSDGNGKVIGSYSFSVADGRTRTVDYLADEGGFRATVRTNEFGTKEESPADVQFYSTATLDEPPAYASPNGAASQGPSMYQPNNVPQDNQTPAVFTMGDNGAYSYSYESKLADGGSISQQESADGSGTVKGSYSMEGADGRQRKVDYSSGEAGFQASVDSNEFGGKMDSPANVVFMSSPALARQVAPVMRSPMSVKAPAAPMAFRNPASPMAFRAPASPMASRAPASPMAFRAPASPMAFNAPAFNAASQSAGMYSSTSSRQMQGQEPAPRPSPYAFNYDADTSSRQEAADGKGTVTGSYVVRQEDGSLRVVDYIADHDGFRANVKTNEPGTQDYSPADVVVKSAAPSQPSPKVERQREQFPVRGHSQKSSMISQMRIKA